MLLLQLSCYNEDKDHRMGQDESPHFLPYDMDRYIPR